MAMKTLLKLILSFAVLGLLGFCGFGFLATFEPNPPATQWTFRIAYGARLVLCLLALRMVWLRRKLPPAL